MFLDNPDDDLDIIIIMHDAIIDASGGSKGLHDEKLLRSALARPLHTVMGNNAYTNTHDRAAALLHSIANNHGFRDGNKRTAMASATFYLALNGVETEFTNEEYETFMVHVVNDKVSVDEISKWLKEHQAK